MLDGNGKRLIQSRARGEGRAGHSPCRLPALDSKRGRTEPIGDVDHEGHMRHNRHMRHMRNDGHIRHVAHIWHMRHVEKCVTW